MQPTPETSTASLTPEYDVAHASVPYVQPSGGDFHAAFVIPDGSGDVGVVLGDVSGHGPELTGQAQSLLGNASVHLANGCSPADALAMINAETEPDPNFQGFASVFVGRLAAETGELTYASAGHEPGLIAEGGQHVEELEPTGPAVGIFPPEVTTFEEKKTILSEGGTLLLHTDGVTDAKRDGHKSERFGQTRLHKVLAALATFPLGVLIGRLIGKVFAFCGGRVSDDMAVLAVRRQPSKKP